MDDCILWTGAKTDRGYGQRRVAGRVVYVHRHAWEQAHGPIPDGLTIDHLCRTKLCTNVAHMELVDRAENSRRATRDVCVNGHPRTPENIYVEPSGRGRRYCRRCLRARWNRADAKARHAP